MRRMAVLTSCMFFAGCAALPDAVETTPTAPASVTKIRLTPVDLGIGECGLFVWSIDDDRRFILFSTSATQSGRWLNDGQEVSLNILEESGTVANGQYPNVVFESDDGQKLELGLKSPQVITDGTRFKAGALKSESEDGWLHIVPVAALSTCKTR